MLLFAEDDLVSTSLIHAQLYKALIYSTRRECIRLKKKSKQTKQKKNKQTAERPIRHIVSYSSGGLDRNSVDMSECIQRSPPFQLFTLIF